MTIWFLLCSSLVSCSLCSSSLRRASAMGHIMAVVAILFSHIEWNQAGNIIPNISLKEWVSLTGHLKCICQSCLCYFRKTGPPPHNFSVVKSFQKCNPSDFRFYLSKLNNKISPYGVILNLGMFFFAFLYYCSENQLKINIIPYGKNIYYLTYRNII